MMKRFCLLLLSLILVLSMAAGCDQPSETTGPNGTVPTTPATAIPTDPAINKELFAGSDSYDSLLAIIEQAISSSQTGNGIYYKNFGAPMVRSSDAAAGKESTQATSGGNYATTNIQVAGVDEADIIKTDGRYLYYLANNRLYVVDAGSVTPQVVYTQYFNPNVKGGSKISGESPAELFLDVASKRLIVIVHGNQYENLPVVTDPTKPIPDATRPTETKPVETKPSATQPKVTSSTVLPPDQPNAASGSGGGSASGSAGVSASSDPAIASTVSPAQDLVGKVDSRMIMPYYNNKQYTITRVYQIDDPKNPKLVRQFTQEGGYLTARMVGGFVYVLTNKYDYRVYYGPAVKDSSTDLKSILPKTTDDPLKDTWTTLPVDRIGIVPGSDPNAQLIVSAISVTKDAQKPELLSLLGASGVVYASASNIYLANYAYAYNEKQPELSKSNMKIYRIGIAGGKVVANGTGTVSGTIINQFAMDEYNGYFRIATTDSGAFWGRTTTESTSTVFVLDKNLKTVGQVGKLGPGETIRSIRFMGDKAYVVTFKTTDPLYVLDLAAPTAPKVLGELKIPGFSTYLHPYGENLLLGFGFNAVTQGTSTFQTSIKVSLFDISNLGSPKELSTLSFGGQGSYTELANNHKALLFSQSKNLIAFPATLTGESGSVKQDGGMLFQGLIVLKVENNSKLVVRGGLSNTSKLNKLTGNGVPYNQITKEDQMALSGYDTISRGLYIDNRLITLSGRLIRQYDLDTLQKLGETALKGYEDFYGYAVDLPMVQEGPAIAK